MTTKESLNGNVGTDGNMQWPVSAQVAALLFALLLAAGLIVLPVVGTVALESRYGVQPTGDSAWGSMIAILLGLTTMTVSGIFVFMTFRIDRGARLEAQKTARKMVDDMQADAIVRLQRNMEGLVEQSRVKIKKELERVRAQVKDAEERLKKHTESAVTEINVASQKTTESVAATVEKGVEGVQTLFADTQSHIESLGEKMEKSVGRASAAMETEIDANRTAIQEVFEQGQQELKEMFEEAKKKD